MKDIEFNKVNRSVLKNMILTYNKEKETVEKSVLSDDIKDISKIIDKKQSSDEISVFKELSDEQIEARMKEESSKKSLASVLSGQLSNIKSAILKGDVAPLGKPEVDPDRPLDPDDPTPDDPDNPLNPGITFIEISPDSGFANHLVTGGDDVTVEVSYNGKTFLYSLVSETSQRIGFKVWNDGRLVVNGNGVTITTPDNQNSDVMLLGETNKIVTGNGSKTHIANNLYYSSSEGGSQITTWASTVTPSDEGYTYDDSNVTMQRTLSRGDSAIEDLRFGSDDKLELTLTNPFTGSDYKYIITNRTTEELEATFEFLSNGRLLIKGSGLEISAAANQQDDIILIGSSCVVNTGNYADTVRNGVVIDDNQENYYYNCIDNVINTGSGDDYVKIYNPTLSNINMGDGNDKLLYVENTYNLTTVENAELMQNITILQLLN